MQLSFGEYHLLGIYLLDIYRSCNIGIFARANNTCVLVPLGLARTKMEKIAEFLDVKIVGVSIGGSRLVGPLVAMNDNGILVSKLADDDEIASLKHETGMHVERLESRYTSVGNMVAANDKGAIISGTFSRETAARISEVLRVPVRQISLASYIQAGSMITTTSSGALVHPLGSEMELKVISETLKVDVEPGTVNNGVPFVSSGIIANNKAAVVGSLTRGPELMILARALKL